MQVGGAGGKCWDSRARGPGPDGSHLWGEAAPFLPPGDGGTGHTWSPAVQPDSAAFVHLGPLWTHLDPGPIAPCRQSPVRIPLWPPPPARPVPPTARSSHRARGVRPGPHAAQRCCGHGTGTGLGLRARQLAGAGCHRGSVPSEEAGHRGPLTWRKGVSTCWDGHYCLSLQPRVLPLVSHIQDSQALNVIPATASPVHSRVG